MQFCRSDLTQLCHFRKKKMPMVKSGRNQMQTYEYKSKPGTGLSIRLAG